MMSDNYEKNRNVKPEDIIQANTFDELQVVNRDDEVDECYGTDGIFNLTEEHIKALREGKVLYSDCWEYFHLIIMKEYYDGKK